MTLNLHAPETEEQLKPRITVVGVGGAGGNAVNNMIQSNLEGVEFLVCNTDAQALTQSQCQNRLQLGRSLTRGLGGGSRPDVGRAAAEEQLEELSQLTADSDMLFIAAGMGGATGTGAAPVIARTAREKGILTVAVVTKPFSFEGVHRMRVAEQGITELAAEVDTLIIIPNQNLFRIANEKTTFADAFRLADEVLHSGVRGVTDLVVRPGLINLDFADIRSVMTEMGKAMMGTGEASGENRAVGAAEAAISNPLLDDVSMRGARGVLINITGGPDLTLFELDEAANRIRDEVDPEANIIFGSTFDPSLDGVMRISVVATGIEAEEARKPRPVTLSVVSDDQHKQQQKEVPAAEAAPSQRREPQPQRAQAADAPAPAMEPRHEQAPTMAQSPMTQERDFPVAEEHYGEREDAFIAPPATQAPRQPKMHGPLPGATQHEEPRQSREQPARSPRSRASTLFAHITGAARSIQGERDRPREEPRRAAEPKLTGGREERSVREGDPRGAPQEPMHTPASAAHASMQPNEKPQREPISQSRLSGLEPNERYDSRGMEEDELDIPAFLRRQAN